MVALTRTRTWVVLTVLKACFAVEVSVASLFKISVDTLTLGASVAISAGLVWGVLVRWWRLGPSKQLGGRLTCGLHALVCWQSGPSLNNSAEVYPSGENLSDVAMAVWLGVVARDNR